MVIVKTIHCFSFVFAGPIYSLKFCIESLLFQFKHFFLVSGKALGWGLLKIMGLEWDG